MEIAEIKSHLSIETVLAHYGLRPDGHHRLQCPFHPDKTPSLQIYPQTNTYCCFSSNCQAGTGDVIQFIGLMERCSKHEALVKDHRINAYQGQAAAGKISHDREDQYKELFKNMQRLLIPIRVVNPYAGQIRLPEQVFKPRRTMTLLLGFMEAITFYHQYQRGVKRDDTGRPYIETTVADIAAAFRLLTGVLFSKSDELTQAARVFLEQLKEMQHQEGWVSFNAREIRERLRIHPGTLKRYLAELVRYGYLKGSGNRYRNTYEYTICHPEEYEGLKSSVEHHLQAILEAIGQTNQAAQ